MTRYILDTDVLINASKNREPDRSWVLSHLRDGDHIAVSVITVAEFYAGVRHGQDPRFDAFIDELPVVTVTREMAIVAGTYRYEHARQGVALAIADCLIAAAGSLSGAVIVTHNGKDYPMPGVSVLVP